MKVAYGSTNEVKDTQQMHMHRNQYSSLDCTKETLTYLVLRSWYKIDSATVFNILLAANKWRNTCTVHLYDFSSGRTSHVSTQYHNWYII